jgi:hypothetical protein
LREFNKTFDVPAGAAIYIGDFTGRVEFRVFEKLWQISNVSCQFDDTTKDFRAKYPNLTNLPCSCPFAPGNRLLARP